MLISSHLTTCLLRNCQIFATRAFSVYPSFLELDQTRTIPLFSHSSPAPGILSKQRDGSGPGRLRDGEHLWYRVRHTSTDLVQLVLTDNYLPGTSSFRSIQLAHTTDTRPSRRCCTSSFPSRCRYNQEAGRHGHSRLDTCRDSDRTEGPHTGMLSKNIF